MMTQQTDRKRNPFRQARFTSSWLPEDGDDDDEEEVDEQVGPDTEGWALLPGFNDCFLGLTATNSLRVLEYSEK